MSLQLIGVEKRHCRVLLAGYQLFWVRDTALPCPLNIICQIVADMPHIRLLKRH